MLDEGHPCTEIASEGFLYTRTGWIKATSPNDDIRSWIIAESSREGIIGITYSLSGNICPSEIRGETCAGVIIVTDHIRLQSRLQVMQMVPDGKKSGWRETPDYSIPEYLPVLFSN